MYFTSASQLPRPGTSMNQDGGWGWGTVESWDSENSIGGMTPAERHSLLSLQGYAAHRRLSRLSGSWQGVAKRDKKKDTRPCQPGLQVQSRGAKSNNLRTREAIGSQVRAYVGCCTPILTAHPDDGDDIRQHPKQPAGARRYTIPRRELKAREPTVSIDDGASPRPARNFPGARPRATRLSLPLVLLGCRGGGGGGGETRRHRPRPTRTFVRTDVIVRTPASPCPRKPTRELFLAGSNRGAGITARTGGQQMLPYMDSLL